ncbi:UvrD-helicase domain-containing protein [Leifsonia sp. H3M29-4]|uniref:UvrD-helicase domain-containing protein n=1 Tax=Salinibacterium metalliresistens TaxID=3031321 RepID=UPI0023DB8DFC|nr:UvrD-helicase domain-containing protein [Salinibacterium metalliresistens]MDF1478916.1 UvrD-helicase domain-containing protein [Salinibacterium metalliresistens]
MTSSELSRERDYVAGLYARLDALRDDAQRRLEEVRRSNPGGTHQNRSERDAFARIYEDRVGQLRGIDERLAFGRLAMDDGALHYIGRIGLRDEDQQPLLLDWRVPQARAFYQATAATPLGARARRHLQSQGREIVRIDDEIFDPELLDGDVSGLQGEAALMATLTAQRTGRMGDIVATIQAEQDAIIRSELRGTLVVQGGPGTGKTAVALHRAAYLLYSHRETLSKSGVLIVGPSRSFLQYIEAVLPSLGETGVVLASVGQLFPGVDVATEDDGDVAALKGSLEMASLLARAVKSRQVVPTQPQVVDVNGELLTVPPQLIQSAMQRAWDTRKPHNVARVTFNKAALAALGRLLADQLRSHGNTIEDSDQAWLREDLRTAHDVKVLLNTAWLPLTPQKLLQDLYARPQWLASLTPRWSPARRALLRRDRDAAFTVSDVALLDEAAELLGEMDLAAGAADRERKQQRKRDIENAEAAIRNMGVEGLVDAETLADGFEAVADRGTTAELAAADREWTYGHIVVDEAQELSPMQWRLLVRRNPLKSFTIVGDVAQASAAAGASSWAEALRPHVGDAWRLEELTVNYRTPAQVVEVAERMALAHGVQVTRSRSVREGEWPVEVLVTDDLAVGVRDAVRSDLDAALGTIAVVASDSLLPALYPGLAAEFGRDIGLGAAGLSRAVAVLTPQEAKGLEFDAVVVAEPGRIVSEIPRGAAALYVAMTRPTQRLQVVSTGDVPRGIR